MLCYVCNRWIPTKRFVDITALMVDYMLRSSLTRASNVDLLIEESDPAPEASDSTLFRHLFLHDRARLSIQHQHIERRSCSTFLRFDGVPSSVGWTVWRACARKSTPSSNDFFLESFLSRSEVLAGREDGFDIVCADSISWNMKGEEKGGSSP